MSYKPYAHVYDGDAVCVVCGHDGAEWHHWRHSTHEGIASPGAREPSCKREATQAEIAQARHSFEEAEADRAFYSPDDFSGEWDDIPY